MMNNKKVLFVLNKKAGNNQSKDIIEILTSHAKANGYDYSIFEMGNNPESGVKSAILDYKPTIVAALGGDGTVNLIANILKKKDIALLIIPMGSANGMAKELQIQEDIDYCLDLIVKGTEKYIDLLQVNKKISIHLSDVGLNARIVKRFQLDNGRGLFVYAKHLFFEAFLLKRNVFEIKYENNTKTIKAVSLTFANATMYGTGAVINPDGKLNDGYFEICIVKPFPKYHVFKIAFQMFRNTLKYSMYFEVIKCKMATIKALRATTLQVDGEVLNRVKEIKLTCLPNQLKVLIDPKLRHPTLID